jgi:hypothetical protein
VPDLTVWPTDGADGSVSSEARWRKMARMWVPSGVDGSALGVGGGAGALAPTLVAGPTINVAIGSCWVDGHYAELLAPASVPATANGLLVVRFTPADNHAELLYRDAAVTPTQTLATWELVIASMAAGVMTDQRRQAQLGGLQTLPACILKLPAAVNHPQGTLLVPFGAGSEVHDPLGMHDTVTNNHRITAQVRGIYEVAAGANWAATGTANYRIVSINNQASQAIAQQQMTQYGGSGISVACHNLMNPGDLVYMNVIQDSPTAQSLAAAQLSLAYLGPA